MAGVFETEEERVATDAGWGHWGLGDLADVVRRTAELLGTATGVRRIAVEPPHEELGLPIATVVVRDEEAVSALADRISRDEKPTRFCGNSFGGGWVAEVDDMELHVAPELESWR